jgi:ribonuclease Z
MAPDIGTFVHSDPTEAGYVFGQIKPRLAVVFHFYNDFDTAAEIERAIRIHYRGRLVLATDLWSSTSRTRKSWSA